MSWIIIVVIVVVLWAAACLCVLAVVHGAAIAERRQRNLRCRPERVDR